jgi:hypothetical protein
MGFVMGFIATQRNELPPFGQRFSAYCTATKLMTSWVILQRSRNRAEGQP